MPYPSGHKRILNIFLTFFSSKNLESLSTSFLFQKDDEDIYIKFENPSVKLSGRYIKRDIKLGLTNWFTDDLFR